MIDLSLAPMANMVFLSLTGSHGLPLALASMVFLYLTGSHGLLLALAPMIFLSRWLQWSSCLIGSNGIPLTLASCDMDSTNASIITIYTCMVVD
jgi:hypothetical protein